MSCGEVKGCTEFIGVTGLQAVKDCKGCRRGLWDGGFVGMEGFAGWKGSREWKVCGDVGLGWFVVKGWDLLSGIECTGCEEVLESFVTESSHYTGVTRGTGFAGIVVSNLLGTIRCSICLVLIAVTMILLKLKKDVKLLVHTVSYISLMIKKWIQRSHLTLHSFHVHKYLGVTQSCRIRPSKFCHVVNTQEKKKKKRSDYY